MRNLKKKEEKIVLKLNGSFGITVLTGNRTLELIWVRGINVGDFFLVSRFPQHFSQIWCGYCNRKLKC